MDLAPRTTRAAPTDEQLEEVLGLQLAVAWAGEGGEEPRLGWWRTFMVHEDGGLALFADLTPRTHRWVVFQGAREAARRVDAAQRAREADPDQLITLFHLGFEIDERLDERLHDLKGMGADPLNALPTLRGVCGAPFNRSTFNDWATGLAEIGVVTTPSGRRLTGAPPTDLVSRARALVASLAPLSPAYPLPHYKTA